MSAWAPTIGETVCLVPTLPTAPTAAYRHPKCTVLAVGGRRVTVRVGDQDITTDLANVRATRPDTRPGRHRRPASPPVLPDGYEQPDLF